MVVDVSTKIEDLTSPLIPGLGKGGTQLQYILLIYDSLYLRVCPVQSRLQSLLSLNHAEIRTENHNMT